MWCSETCEKGKVLCIQEAESGRNDIRVQLKHLSDQNCPEGNKSEETISSQKHSGTHTHYSWGQQEG